MTEFGPIQNVGRRLLGTVFIVAPYESVAAVHFDFNPVAARFLGSRRDEGDIVDASKRIESIEPRQVGSAPLARRTFGVFIMPAEIVANIDFTVLDQYPLYLLFLSINKNVEVRC